MIMEQEKYWDKASLTKDFTTPFKMDLFCKYVEKDHAVLDFGCGYGRVLADLTKKGFGNLTGIDYSEDMIKRGHTLLSDVKLIHSDSGDLPFEDNSFDAVLLVAVLTCISSDDALLKTIDEIKRVLKKGGVLYINDFLLNSDERNIKRYEQHLDKGPYGTFELPDGALLRHFEKSKILDLLKHFKTITFDKVVFTTMNKNRSNGFTYMGSLE